MQAKLDRLVQDGVISQNEATDVEYLVLLGDVSETTAIHYLSRIESIRSMSPSERSRCGTVCVLGHPVSGSGYVCRTLKV